MCSYFLGYLNFKFKSKEESFSSDFIVLYEMKKAMKRETKKKRSQDFKKERSLLKWDSNSSLMESKKRWEKAVSAETLSLGFHLRRL